MSAATTRPTSVRVAGRVYDIDWTPAHPDSDYRAIGRARHDQQRVWVDGSLKEARAKDVLLHELLHCVSVMFSGNDTLSEEQVIVLENGLMALFRDNPGLADYLFKD